ncbi:MAG: molecular chaperone HtpG [Desulfuromonas sp.]|nr:MAG: molecular chaperone HtpG [Desulfuromonas sp.]
MSDQVELEQGNISIHTENIFPIIKKWLYSEHDIFLRELVSNAVDAIHKLQHVNLVEGLQLSEDYGVDITVDEKAKTLTVKDNGVGMTADEVRKYINQIAFSSAEEFVEKFKDLEDKNQIIGHFGLGFYSAFMVASQVEIRTLSYQEGAAAVHWKCNGSTDYQIGPCDKAERGTEIILHLSNEEEQYLKPSRVREVLKRFCNFLPLPIRLAGDQINDSDPLWCKTPSEVTDEEYQEFYRKLYPLAVEPLFWIHLNIDFPFNLKGIVYFPKLTTEFDLTKSHIKLFCNQVFVSDNCQEMIPEFLVPLQGCLDAPDLPLNVSRSYLQNEPQVRKIREVLAGKVAAKLGEIAKGDAEEYARIWDDIHTFIKYGVLQDEKFYKKTKDHLLFRTTDASQHTTLKDYLERGKEKYADQVYYASDESAQASYLRMFRNQDIEVLLLDAPIDSHLISFLEHQEENLKFLRIDSEATDNLLQGESGPDLVTGEDGKSSNERIADLFKGELDQDGLTIRVDALKDGSVPAVILLDEGMRRFQEMTRMLGKEAKEIGEHTLLVNAACPTIKNLLSLNESGETSAVSSVVHQVYDLARLAQGGFDQASWEAFIGRSQDLLQLASRPGSENTE